MRENLFLLKFPYLYRRNIYNYSNQCLFFIMAISCIEINVYTGWPTENDTA